MANSKYEYVKSFETNDQLLPCTWIVVRIDGRHFHRFSDVHEFEKPNEMRALQLMNECAKAVLEDLPEIIFAYGESDEYSFVICKNSTLYQRRASKLVSVIVSLFASTFVLMWATFFPGKKLQYAPSFDGRAVCYPTDSILRDYLAWRQVDCHINNQFNTCLWKMVQGGKSKDMAYQELKGTNAEFKNEMLFKEFGINYSKLPEVFRKGTCVFRKRIQEADNRMRTAIAIEHCDIIGDKFWKEYSYILETLKEEKVSRSPGLQQHDEVNGQASDTFPGLSC